MFLHLFYFIFASLHVSLAQNATVIEGIGAHSGCLDYYYVKYSDSLKNATTSYRSPQSTSGGALQSCRIKVDGNIIPGFRLIAPGTLEACYIFYSGQNYTMGADPEVLTHYPGSEFQWERAGNLPRSAFAGGRTKTGDPLYVIRCAWYYPDGGLTWFPGYFQPSVGAFTGGGIHEGWAGKCGSEQMEFLVCN